MSSSATGRPSENYAGDQPFSPDARANGRGESLKVHVTESSKEVTV